MIKILTVEKGIIGTIISSVYHKKQSAFDAESSVENEIFIL